MENDTVAKNKQTNKKPDKSVGKDKQYLMNNYN